MIYAIIWIALGLCSCFWINYRDWKDRPGLIVNLSIVICGPVGLIMLVVGSLFGGDDR